MSDSHDGHVQYVAQVSQAGERSAGNTRTRARHPPPAACVCVCVCVSDPPRALLQSARRGGRARPPCNQLLCASALGSRERGLSAPLLCAAPAACVCTPPAGMRFAFCGGLACPEWVLGEVATISRLSSVRIKLLVMQVAKRLTTGAFDAAKVHTHAQPAEGEGGGAEGTNASHSVLRAPRAALREEREGRNSSLPGQGGRHKGTHARTEGGGPQARKVWVGWGARPRRRTMPRTVAGALGRMS